MKKGVEKTGLRWTIDELAGDDIPIRIYNKDGKLLVDYSYKCMHRPIFGLDADDVVEINKILDQLLKECESEVNNIAEDIISRQATIDAIKNYFHDEYYQRTSIQDCRDCLIEDVIKSLPSVTPQQRTGRWIDAEVLDNIRAEIETDLSHFCFDEWGNENPTWKEIKAIIDKYKAESEEKE